MVEADVYYSYRRFNRCTPCGDWKPKDMKKCDYCKTTLRTKPRSKKYRRESEITLIA